MENWKIAYYLVRNKYEVGVGDQSTNKMSFFFYTPEKINEIVFVFYFYYNLCLLFEQGFDWKCEISSIILSNNSDR